MKCPACGNEVSSNDKYCKKCGCDMVTIRRQQNKKKDAEAKPEEKRKAVKPVLMIAAGCLLLLIIVCVAMFAFPVNTDQKRSTSVVSVHEEMSEVQKSAVDESSTDAVQENAVPENAVAAIGEKYYTALEDAISDAQYGDTVALLADIREDVYIQKDRCLTLDLQGHTLTNDSEHTILNEGELVIQGEGTVDNITPNRAAVLNAVSGVIKLNGGLFTRSKENGVEEQFTASSNTFYTVTNYGTMTINGAIIQNNGTYSTTLHNGWKEDESQDNAVSAVLRIENGSVEGGIFAVKNDLYGILEIQGGSFSGSKQALIYNKAEADITGGVYTEAPVAILNHGDGKTAYNLGKCHVSGGKFETDKFSEVGKNAPKIVKK